jgi:hypothetical protein
LALTGLPSLPNLTSTVRSSFNATCRFVTELITLCDEVYGLLFSFRERQILAKPATVLISKQIPCTLGAGLLHDFIKTFVQRAAGYRPKAVPVFLRGGRSRMRLDRFRGLPFFDYREMIRPYRVL